MIIIAHIVWMVKCIISIFQSLDLLHLLLLNLSILTYGVLHLSIPSKVFDIMFCLLIIILDSPGCTCLDQNLKSLLSFFILKLWLKINSQPKSRFSNLMEVVSTPLMSLNTTCHNKASSIKLLVVTPLSKIVLLRGNTCISLRPLSHFCHKHLCPHPNGHMLSTLTLINLLPTFVPSFQSPWYKLHFSPPDLSQLRVFGCACYPHLRSYTTHKLESRTKECIFLGYPSTSKGYLCPDLQTKQLYTSRHVLFNKSKFPFSLLTPFLLHHLLLLFFLIPFGSQINYIYTPQIILPCLVLIHHHHLLLCQFLPPFLKLYLFLWIHRTLLIDLHLLLFPLILIHLI